MDVRWRRSGDDGDVARDVARIATLTSQFIAPRFYQGSILIQSGHHCELGGLASGVGGQDRGEGRHDCDAAGL